MLNTLAGIIASSGGAAAGGSYESISTVTVGAGGASSISFTSIPSTYQHLQLRIMARTNDSAAAADWLIQFNSDGGNNYARHYLRGDGSSASASANATTGAMYAGTIAGNTAGSSIFGVLIIDILDYKDTNKNTTMRSLGGVDSNSVQGFVGLWSGLWMNTAAVSTITLFGTTVQHSQVALYGIKG